MKLLYLLGIHVIIYGVILFVDKWTDLKRIKANQPIHHLRGGLLRFIALLGNILWLPIFWSFNWVILSQLLMLECAIWWIVFDIWLNTGNHQTPFHVGGSWIDKQFLKLNYGDYWIILTKGVVLGGILSSLLF